MGRREVYCTAKWAACGKLGKCLGIDLDHNGQLAAALADQRNLAPSRRPTILVPLIFRFEIDIEHFGRNVLKDFRFETIPQGSNRIECPDNTHRYFPFQEPATNYRHAGRGYHSIIEHSIIDACMKAMIWGTLAPDTLSGYNHPVILGNKIPKG
jgi:hypothetical protein